MVIIVIRFIKVKNCIIYILIIINYFFFIIWMIFIFIDCFFIHGDGHQGPVGKVVVFYFFLFISIFGNIYYILLMI